MWLARITHTESGPIACNPCPANYPHLIQMFMGGVPLWWCYEQDAYGGVDLCSLAGVVEDAPWTVVYGQGHWGGPNGYGYEPRCTNFTACPTCNPCPPEEFPVLLAPPEFGGEWWCYEDHAYNSGSYCKMSHAGFPAPGEGGNWGDTGTECAPDYGVCPSTAAPTATTAAPTTDPPSMPPATATASPTTATTSAPLLWLPVLSDGTAVTSPSSHLSPFW